MKIPRNRAFLNNPEAVFVPIGNDCSVAHYLRKIGLRYSAYPFDWTVTPIESALHLIKNKFDGFMEEENCLFLKPEKRMLFKEDGETLYVSKEMITPVICRKYRILYAHDFSQDGKNEFDAVKEKYIRRAQRLLTLLENDVNKVVFVFNARGINKWQAEKYLIGSLPAPESISKSTVARLLTEYADIGVLDSISLRSFRFYKSIMAFRIEI